MRSMIPPLVAFNSNPRLRSRFSDYSSIVDGAGTAARFLAGPQVQAGLGAASAALAAGRMINGALRQRRRRARRAVARSGPMRSSSIYRPAAIQTTNAPVAVGTSTAGLAPTATDRFTNGRRVRTVTGEEVWTTLTNNNTSSDTGVARVVTPSLNPVTMAVEFLSTSGIQFQKFKFLRGTTLKWRPTVPTTMTGQIVMGYITDAGGDYAEFTFDDIQRLPGAKIGNIWEPMDMVLTEAPEMEKYVQVAGLGSGGAVTPSDIRIGTQGLFIVAVAGVPTTGTPSVAVGGPLGRLMIDYACELYDLNMNPASLAGVDVSIPTTPATGVSSANLASFATQLGAWWNSISPPEGAALQYIGSPRRFHLQAFVSDDADDAVSSFGAVFADQDGNDLTPTNVVSVLAKNSAGSTNNNVRAVSFDISLARFATLTLNNAIAGGNIIAQMQVLPASA